jgi:hypothetical protein
VDETAREVDMKWTKARLGLTVLTGQLVIIAVTAAVVLQTRDGVDHNQWRVPAGDSAVTASEGLAGGGLASTPRNRPKVGATPTTGSSRSGTYKRDSASGINLDLLPGGEGEDSPTGPIKRITGPVAIDFPEVRVGDNIGSYPLRVSSTDGRPVDRPIRIGGPQAQDFPLQLDGCSDTETCPPEGFFCGLSVCEFATTFAPTAVGKRVGWLEVGSKKYRLRGVGTPGDAEEGNPEREPSPSSSALRPSSTQPSAGGPPNGAPGG